MAPTLMINFLVTKGQKFKQMILIFEVASEFYIFQFGIIIIITIIQM